MGSFPCDNFTKCVLQRQICDKYSYCDDMYDEDALECGLFHGSLDFTTSVYEKKNRPGNKIEKCGKKCCFQRLLTLYRHDSL